MCDVLKLPRATYYYKAKAKPNESLLVTSIKEIFQQSRNNYGTRKIKKELKKQNLTVSRRRIDRIMKQEGLVSTYTIAQFKPHVAKCNEDNIANIVDRKFNDQSQHNVVVSDLTYVRVENSWNYICLLLDLFNREIIGYSAGRNKDAKPVMQAFSKVETNLENINNFHTDRGNEFKNRLIDETLEAFGIERSPSIKGCPYDNAVTKATYKIIKTESVKTEPFHHWMN